MCPVLGKSLNRAGTFVCHTLLVESGDGLVLVDTGFGLADLAEPARHLGGAFAALVRPSLDPAGTAVRQVEALGFRASDVRHIVVTHLDLDHAGGIADFPDATVHCFRPEHDAATARRTLIEKNRYRPHQIRGARFVLHEPSGEGDRWFGFAAVKPLAVPGIAIVPLVGHTRGHAGVAVEGDGGWLLHCGDAYFHDNEMDVANPRCPAMLSGYQRLMALDNARRLENQGHLRELIKSHGSEVRLFCAHDPVEFAAFADGKPRQPREEAA